MSTMIKSHSPILTPPANDDGSEAAPKWSWTPVGIKGRIEMLKLWDGLSEHGKRFLLTTARAKAEEEAATQRR